MREFQDLAESTFPEWPSRELSEQMRVSRTWQKLKKVWQEWILTVNSIKCQKKKGLIKESPRRNESWGSWQIGLDVGCIAIWSKVAMLPAFTFLSSRNPSSNWNKSRTLTKTEVSGLEPHYPAPLTLAVMPGPSLELERWASLLTHLWLLSPRTVIFAKTLVLELPEHVCGVAIANKYGIWFFFLRSFLKFLYFKVTTCCSFCFFSTPATRHPVLGESGSPSSASLLVTYLWIK